MRDRNLRKEHSKEKKMQRSKGGCLSSLSKEIQGSTVSEGDTVGDEVRGIGVYECVCVCVCVCVSVFVYHVGPCVPLQGFGLYLE